MKFPISDEALAQHTAIVGKTGSGKTTVAKGAVEHLVSQGARVCILDPIKSDWWGLTSSADGKKAGLPFQILGGPRGHVPLHPTSGRVIAELVASGDLPLCILDMADFPPGGMAQFFNDFAPMLLRKIKGVVHLVLEEAHEFAPKERAGIGNENMLIHNAKKLATAGRSKGIRMILATQRTQSLHNAMLGSCETMVAMKLKLPADKKPVVDWLKDNLEKDRAAEVAASLSKLKTGSGYLCVPDSDTVELVQFPRIKTYDNSATPEAGVAAADEVRTAAVDVGKLRELVGAAVAEADANDPAKLKAEIARLSRELAKPTPVGNVTVGLAVDTKPVQAAIAAAREEGAAAVRAMIPELLDAQHKASLAIGIEMGAEAVTEAARRAAVPGEPLYPPRKSLPAERAMKSVRAAVAAAEAPLRGGKVNLETRTIPYPVKTPVKVEGLTGPQSNLLRSLAWWRAMGHQQVTRAQAAAIAKWQPNGSNVKDRTTELKRLGLVVADNGILALTPDGVAMAPQPDTSQTLVDSIRAILTGPQTKVFDHLLTVDGGIHRADLAAAIGWEPDGSNIKDRITELVRLEVAEYMRPSVVKLQDWVA